MSVTHQEFVTQDTLKSVLSAIRSSGRSDKHNVFIKFASLRQIQSRMKMLKNIMVDQKILVEYAVTELLAEIIQHQLDHSRLLLSIAPQQKHNLSSRSQAFRDIQQDAQSQAPYLIGWSLLYHLYIRSDLNISLNEFAEYSFVDVRTLRRYKSCVVKTLLKYIIRIEEELANS